MFLLRDYPNCNQKQHSIFIFHSLVPLCKMNIIPENEQGATVCVSALIIKNNNCCNNNNNIQGLEKNLRQNIMDCVNKFMYV